MSAASVEESKEELKEESESVRAVPRAELMTIAEKPEDLPGSNTEVIPKE